MPSGIYIVIGKGTHSPSVSSDVSVQGLFDEVVVISELESTEVCSSLANAVLIDNKARITIKNPNIFSFTKFLLNNLSNFNVIFS